MFIQNDFENPQTLHEKCQELANWIDDEVGISALEEEEGLRIIKEDWEGRSVQTIKSFLTNKSSKSSPTSIRLIDALNKIIKVLETNEPFLLPEDLLELRISLLFRADIVHRANGPLSKLNSIISRVVPEELRPPEDDLELEDELEDDAVDELLQEELEEALALHVEEEEAQSLVDLLQLANNDMPNVLTKQIANLLDTMSLKNLIALSECREEFAQRAINKDPDAVATLYVLAVEIMEKEPDTALQLFNFVTQKYPNYANAHYYIGMYHWNGSAEVPPNKKLAAISLTKAAKLDHADAQYRLGCYYDYEGAPEELDQAQALIWYSKAAEQDHEEAQLAIK